MEHLPSQHAYWGGLRGVVLGYFLTSTSGGGSGPLDILGPCLVVGAFFFMAQRGSLPGSISVIGGIWRGLSIAAGVLAGLLFAMGSLHATLCAALSEAV